MFDLLIAGGRLVAADGSLQAADVGIRDGRIAAIGAPATGAPEPARQVLAATGSLVLPGVIDLHTHLRSPVPEPALFTGETASAVAGGITTIGDFGYPPGARFELGRAQKAERLGREALCDFCVHTVVQAPEHLEGAGYTVKVFLAASGLGGRAGDGLELVRRAAALGHRVLVHVEDLADYVAIARHVSHSSDPGRVHILHVPHQRYASAVRDLAGDRVTMETCPHYLLWEWTRGRDGCNVNPAVVPADLWPELGAGHITTLGTDHCSYRWQEKQDLGLPGFPGVETLLPIVATCGVRGGRISWADLCRLLSTGPAQVLGLYPRKGAVQVGSDADLVLFDPEPEQRVAAPRYGRSDFSPYTGLCLNGRVVATLVRGRPVYRDGAADLGAAGWGTLQEPPALDWYSAIPSLPR